MQRRWMVNSGRAGKVVNCSRSHQGLPFLSGVNRAEGRLDALEDEMGSSAPSQLPRRV